MNDHDEKLDQSAEKFEMDYSEMKDLKFRIEQVEEKTAQNSADCKDLKERIDLAEDGQKTLAERLRILEENLTIDRAKTILQIADHSERLDHTSNGTKAHCVLITGE